MLMKISKLEKLLRQVTDLVMLDSIDEKYHNKKVILEAVMAAHKEMSPYEIWKPYLQRKRIFSQAIEPEIKLHVMFQTY